VQTVWETLFLLRLLHVYLYNFFNRSHVTVCLISHSDVLKILICMCTEYNYNITKADSIVSVTIFILCL
jgi:hypothetical protein